VCLEAFEGRKTLSDVSETYSLLEGIEKQDEIEFITDSFEDLAQSVHRDAGIKWRLPSLQESLGSLNKGDFGFIFARPETGKTTFLASEISHFVEQVEGPIIWFNNEERGDKVKTRVCQANLGLSLEEMFSNLLENEKIYLTNTKSLVKIYDKGFIHKREVEKVVKQLNPSLVVFDQIDKIKGFKGDREDLKLGAIYMWARELAKDYCPVIGVCQAAASAENKRWLDMDDVAKSKTEKAAEADFIIGIGKRYDIGEEETRFLHLIKNKLTGIHARITCRIDANIARYKDI
jgi:replicative DNA helicase